MKRILVGIDGSETSMAAVVWVANNARALGAEVIAVSAFDIEPVVTMPGAFVATDQWVSEWQEAVQRDLDGGWTKPLREAGVDFTTRVAEGHAADVIIRIAEQDAVELIVVGSRGRGSVRELFLGSVSHALTLRAPCPVMIVPHALAAAPRQPLAASSPAHQGTQ